MNIHITIKNAFTRVSELDFTTTVTEGSNVDHMYEVYSKAYPDCFVNFNMGERGWIAGQPYNMVVDESRMTWEDYISKWYPSLAGGKKFSEMTSDVVELERPKK